MRFVVLDSWRGICALLVAIFHLEALSHFYPIDFFRHSFLFVDFFFVLSGFVICLSYFDRLRTGRDTLVFAVRRFGRLWPLHLVMTLVFLPPELLKLYMVEYQGFNAADDPFSGRYSWTSLWQNISLTQCLGEDKSLTWNYPSWSISFEFYAYLVFAALCFVVKRYFVFSALALLCLAAVLLVNLSDTYMGTKCDNGFYRCIYGFFTGCLLYLLYQRVPKPSAKHRHWVNGLEILALLMVIVFVSYAGNGPWSMLAPWVFALTVWIFAWELGWLSRLLSLKPFVALGHWSYSIYLVHVFVLMLLGRAASVVEQGFDISVRLSPEQTGAHSPLLFYASEYLMDLLLVAYVIAVIGLASLTYRFVEDPGRHLFNRWARALAKPRQ